MRIAACRWRGFLFSGHWFALLLAVCPGFAFADELTSEETERLLAELGHSSFQVREAAEKRLVELGPLVAAAIYNHSPSGDPEARLRLARLMKRMVGLHHRRLLSEATASPSLEMLSRLPGWKAYAELVEPTDEARQLFLMMQLEEPQIMWHSQHSPEKLSQLFNERVNEIHQFQPAIGPVPATNPAGQPVVRRPPPMAGTFAALLFAQILNPMLGGPVQTQFTSLMYRNEMHQVLRQPAQRSPTMFQLTNHWVSVCQGIDPHHKIQLAIRYGLPAGVIEARNQLIPGKAIGHQKHYALVLLGRFGCRSDLELVEQSLEDGLQISLITLNNQQVRTQVRDVALAVCWRLQDEDPKRHGFLFQQENTDTLYVPGTMGFSDDDKRDAALNQWRRWKLVPPPPALPKP